MFNNCEIIYTYMYVKNCKHAYIFNTPFYLVKQMLLILMTSCMYENSSHQIQVYIPLAESYAKFRETASTVRKEL